MTKNSYDLIQALAKCKIRPGTWDWSFVHQLIKYPSDRALSGAQYRQLQRLAARYREQLAGMGFEVEIGPREVA